MNNTGSQSHNLPSSLKPKGSPGAEYYLPAAVCHLLNISPATLWRLRRLKSFPKPVRLVPGRVVYSKKAVDDYLAAKLS